MSVIANKELNSIVLLNAYKVHILRNIEEMLMQDVKPLVRKAAEAAMADLDGAIHQRMDDLRNETIVRLELNFRS